MPEHLPKRCAFCRYEISEAVLTPCCDAAKRCSDRATVRQESGLIAYIRQHRVPRGVSLRVRTFYTEYLPNAQHHAERPKGAIA